MVPAGLTFTRIGDEFPLKNAPLESVPLQGPVPVKAMLKFVDWPLQIDVVPAIVAVGRAFTVTVAEPVRSPARVPQRLASERAATVYTVVIDGDTLTLIGDVLPLNNVPSDSMPFHGPVPVTTTNSETAVKLHVVKAPVIEAVGRAFTVTVAEPVLSPALELQFASESETMV